MLKMSEWDVRCLKAACCLERVRVNGRIVLRERGSERCSEDVCLCLIFCLCLFTLHRMHVAGWHVSYIHVLVSVHM